MFREIADIKTADMLNLPVPKAEYINGKVKASNFQKEMVEGLSARAEKVRNKMVDASVDNMLKITNDGRKLALDQRLINDMLPFDDESKVGLCIDNIHKIWEEGSEGRLTQLVFCDLSTPRNDGTFSVYDDVRNRLIAKGIPAEEIKFIHEATNEVKKKELFAKVRSGDIRVLLGSTSKMGAGTNIQDRLKALHDLDCPWRPSDLEQRMGRIVRQGNQNLQVKILRYVTEGTFDSYLWQLVENKQKFIGQIMTSKSPVRTAEDVDETALSFAEIKMLATGNPHIKEKMDLDIKVAELTLLKQSYLNEKYGLEDKVIKHFPKEIARHEARVKALSDDIKYLDTQPKSSEDSFCGMKVEGKAYDEKKDAGYAVLQACRAMKSPEAVMIGEYRGFDMYLSFDSMDRVYQMSLKHSLTYKVSLGDDVFGNITRLDNVLSGIHDKLSDAKINLENTIKQQENSKEEIKKPFIYEEELQQKMERLHELNGLLDVGKADEIIEEELPAGEETSLEREEDERQR